MHPMGYSQVMTTTTLPTTPTAPSSHGLQLDMFAEAVTGQRSTEDAIRNAERRIARYYR